jgi:hypothetical protein
MYSCTLSLTWAPDGGGWSTLLPSRFDPAKKTLYLETGLAPGPVWTCAENLAHIGIRSPDRPSRSVDANRL